MSNLHRIRLREPWEVTALENSRVRRSRRFGRPRQLDPQQRVWLVIEELQAGATVRLNGHELAGVAGILRFDVSDLLKVNNRVELEVGADSEVGEIALEIG